MIAAIRLHLAHRRLVKAQKAVRREACQRLADEVERRANSPEIIRNCEGRCKCDELPESEQLTECLGDPFKEKKK